MDEHRSLTHSKWECKYHRAFIPKYRRKALHGPLRQHLGDLIKRSVIPTWHSSPSAVGRAGPPQNIDSSCRAPRVR
jgi:hypothetical protein